MLKDVLARVLSKCGRAVCLGSLLLLAAADAPAPATQSATTQPTTEPTTRQSFLGHPALEAYAAYSQLSLDGKGQQMLDMYLLRTQDEGRAAIALVRADLAAARLASTTRAKFGEDAMKAQQRAFGDARAEWLRVVTDQGGVAVVFIDDNNQPVTSMQFYEGKWRFVISPFIEKIGGADKFVAAADQQRQRAEKLRSEIEAGRFTSADELITSIQTGK